MNLCKGLTAIAIFGLSLNAHGSIISSGEIFNIDGDGDGLIDDRLISQVFFDVTAGTTLTIDSLVWEQTGVDLNGDGELTGFDNVMRVFDGSGTLLISNDDSGSGTADGSVHHYDSVIGYNFATAGRYMVTVGQNIYSAADALLGYQADALLRTDTYCAGFYVNCDLYTQGHADWRLTFTASGGSVSNVTGGQFAQVPEPSITQIPEPSIIALFAAGLCGIGFARRRQS